MNLFKNQNKSNSIRGFLMQNQKRKEMAQTASLNSSNVPILFIAETDERN